MRELSNNNNKIASPSLNASNNLNINHDSNQNKFNNVST